MMFDEMLSKTTAQFANLTAPAKKFNALTVGNLEKLAQFNLEAAKSYSDLGIQQLRAALEVSDAKSLQAYVSNQQKVAKDVGEKLTKDAATLTDLGKQFAAEMQKLAEEQVAGLSSLMPAKKAA